MNGVSLDNFHILWLWWYWWAKFCQVFLTDLLVKFSANLYFIWLRLNWANREGVLALLFKGFCDNIFCLFEFWLLRFWLWYIFFNLLFGFLFWIILRWIFFLYLLFDLNSCGNLRRLRRRFFSILSRTYCCLGWLYVIYDGWSRISLNNAPSRLREN